MRPVNLSKSHSVFRQLLQIIFMILLPVSSAQFLRQSITNADRSSCQTSCQNCFSVLFKGLCSNFCVLIWGHYIMKTTAKKQILNPLFCVQGIAMFQSEEELYFCTVVEVQQGLTFCRQGPASQDHASSDLVNLGALRRENFKVIGHTHGSQVRSSQSGRLCGLQVWTSTVSSQSWHSTEQHHLNLHSHLVTCLTRVVSYPRPQHITSQPSIPMEDLLHTLPAVPREPETNMKKQI